VVWAVLMGGTSASECRGAIECHAAREPGITVVKFELSFAASSKGHAKAYALGPDNTALLPDRAVKQLESAGQSALSANLEAGAARRIIDDVAIDGRRFRIENDLGRPAHVSRWTDPFVETRMCHFDPLKMEDARMPLQIMAPTKSGDRANVLPMLPLIIAIT
jgi:hypothetical protein